MVMDGNDLYPYDPFHDNTIQSGNPQHLLA